jgi:hypothetical protein
VRCAWERSSGLVSPAGAHLRLLRAYIASRGAAWRGRLGERGKREERACGYASGRGSSEGSGCGPSSAVAQGGRRNEWRIVHASPLISSVQEPHGGPTGGGGWWTPLDRNREGALGPGTCHLCIWKEKGGTASTQSRGHSRARRPLSSRAPGPRLVSEEAEIQLCALSRHQMQASPFHPWPRLSVSPRSRAMGSHCDIRRMAA